MSVVSSAATSIWLQDHSATDAVPKCGFDYHPRSRPPGFDHQKCPFFTRGALIHHKGIGCCGAERRASPCLPHRLFTRLAAVVALCYLHVFRVVNLGP